MEDKLNKKAAKKLARERQLMQQRVDKLIREETFDQVNLEKVREKWFQALIDMKMPEMQNNLRHILHYMEKLVEADNFRNIIFEKERLELKEQTTLQAHSHASALDMLYGIYQKRVKALLEAYNEKVTFKKKEAENEFKSIEEKETTTQENMQTMLHQMEQNRNEKEKIMSYNMFLKLDDERSKNTEKYENTRTNFETKMEKRWGEIKSHLTNYEQNIKERKKEYLQLKAKDDADSKIIYHQMKKMQKLFEQLDELKNCYDQCYAPLEVTSKIKDLREEKNKFLETFKQLKTILVNELKYDEMHLKTLTMSSHQIIETLKEVSLKGKSILTLYSICWKMETEFEKVVPVGSSLNLIKQAIEVKDKEKKVKEGKVDTKQETEKWRKDNEIFHKFWKKVGKVRLSKLALSKCLQDMQRTNSNLKISLASYLRLVSDNKSK